MYDAVKLHDPVCYLLRADLSVFGYSNLRSSPVSGLLRYKGGSVVACARSASVGPDDL